MMCKLPSRTLFLLVAVLFGCLSPIDSPLAASEQGVGVETSSFYVPMRDGIRLAVDVHLPNDRAPDVKLPALLELTRYWRGAENPETGERYPPRNTLDLFFLENGYAVVKVDVRGSGASFGNRPMEYGPEEVRDGYDIVQWVVSQSWSNGRVGAYGTSYSGTTAELLPASGHPAVRAVIPGWSDFDVFRSPARPYGLVAASFIQTWSDYVGLLDANNPAAGGLVARVDEDSDGRLRAAAVRDHASNPNVFEVITKAEFRDQISSGKWSLADASVMGWKEEIEASGVPMLVLASWLDAGTADGALLRGRFFDNTQHVVILASMHGGGAHASPFSVGEKPLPPVPSVDEQMRMRLQFFDHHLKGKPSGVESWPKYRYFNLGEEAFRDSEIWPPAGSQWQRYYCNDTHSLTRKTPTSESGRDTYRVDFGVSTGTANRWTTQMGEPVLNLHDRGAMDQRMLTYTTAPLAKDLQITGTPVVTLSLTIDRDDAAVFVYLEAVDPDGRSRYLTEGGLRGIHRKLTRNPYFPQESPYHSYKVSDGIPVVKGQTEQWTLRLWPTSVRIAAGERLRLAIAGADADTFARIPSDGELKITIDRRRDALSFVDLPLVDIGASKAESRPPTP